MKPTPAFGHPSEEGNHLHPLLGGVPRQRRGGFSPAQRLLHGWEEEIPGNMHHTLKKED